MKTLINKKYNSHRETISNFIWRSLQVIGKQGITFLIFILCAKMLTPYDFGIYNYVLAIIFFLIIFGDFGISSATSKYVAEYNAIDKEKLKYVLFNSGIIILGLTIIISILTLLIGPWYLKDKYIYVLYLLPLIFLAPMTSLYDGVYRGLKKFKQLSIISILVGVLAIPMVYYFVKSHGLIGALIAQNIFYFALLLALGFGNRDFHLKWNRLVMKEIGQYSLIVGIANAGLLLYSHIGTLILGQFNYIEEIAYYEIIIKIFNFLILPSMLLATVIAPNNTNKFSIKKYKQLKKNLLRESLFLFIVGLFCAGIFYIISPFLFENFLSHYDINLLTKILNLLLILIPLRFFSSYITIGYMVSGGFARINATLLVFFGILNLILGIIFVNLFGFIGIIYATLICQLMFISIKDIYFYYLLNKLSREK
jgi:O-antigen/teichoic acid export membrane protein